MISLDSTKKPLVLSIRFLENRNKNIIMTDSKQLDEYARLIHRKQFSLQFSPEIEKAYQADLKRQFLSSNQKLVIFGVFLYLSFIVADFIFYNAQFIPLAIFRFSIVSVCLVLLYHIYLKKDDKHVINVTLASNLAMGSQMFLSGMLLFEQPLDIVYAIGIFPIMVYGIVLFRVCYKETMIVVLVLFFGLLLTIALSYPFDTSTNPLFKMMISFLPLLIVFAATICCMGIYTAYSMESLNRHNWLKNKMLAIDAERLNKLTEQLKRLSITDSLTSLYNRRFFDEQLITYWQESKMQHQPISLVMIDIDWFKIYNDTYGHGQGDECLKTISQHLLYHTPSDAIVARYGGEEFIVILPNTASEKAMLIAKELRQAIIDLKIPHVHSPFKYCTASIGIHTSYPAKTVPINQDGITKFLQHVDIALYTAKENGKNQVSVYANSATNA